MSPCYPFILHSSPFIPIHPLEEEWVKTDPHSSPFPIYPLYPVKLRLAPFSLEHLCIADKCANSGWSGCPLGWSGPLPAVHWSFDTNDGSFTHNGSEVMEGKVTCTRNITKYLVFRCIVSFKTSI